MTLSKRVKNLESQSKATDALVLIVSIGDDKCSASIGGIGHMERHPDETEDEFVRRAYATKAAGRPLEELTESERREAFQRGDKERDASPMKTITIGGEINEAV